jgi:hypothetical protein
MASPVAGQAPIVWGEIGEFDDSADFVEAIMTWADQSGSSYLAWNFSASAGPDLITDSALTGTPTTYGQGVKAHLSAVSP